MRSPLGCVGMLCLVVAGCADPKPPPPARIFLRGIAKLHEPVVGATVTVYDQTRAPVWSHESATGDSGAFLIDLDPKVLLDAFEARGSLSIEVTGGAFALSGQPLPGKLLYVFDQFEKTKHSFFHLGAVSTALGHCTRQFPDSRVDGCALGARLIFGIPTYVDLENDLYFQDNYLRPSAVWSAASAHESFDGYFEGLGTAVGTRQPPTTALGAPPGAAADLALFVGKALAQGALSETGGQAAGWLLSGPDVTAEEFKALHDELAAIQTRIAQLEDQLARDHLDQRVATLEKGLGYVDVWNENFIYLAASASSSVSPSPTNLASLREELQSELKAAVAQHDVMSDLRDVHKNLVGTVGMDPLLDLASGVYTTAAAGPGYYPRISSFFEYFVRQQQGMVQILVENDHLRAIEDGSNLSEAAKLKIEQLEATLAQQSDKFLSLVEGNLGLDRIVNPAEKTSESEMLRHNAGYDIQAEGRRSWVTLNWSITPDYTVKHESKKTDCHQHCEPSTGDCWTDCYNQTWYYAEGVYYAKGSGPGSSPELAKADELAFNASLLVEHRPLTVRFYSDPLSNLQPHVPGGCNLTKVPATSLAVKLEDANGTAHAPSDSQVHPLVLSKQLYYPANSTYHVSQPPWAPDAQMARFQFRDLPKGSYKLSPSNKHLFVVPGEGAGLARCSADLVNGHVAYDAYYDAAAMVYDPAATDSQNLLIMLYSPLR